MIFSEQVKLCEKQHGSVVAAASLFVFGDSRQQLGVSVCRPLGGVVSSPSLHPAGQSAGNRSLGRRGGELPLMPDEDRNTLTPRGQQ